MNPGFVHSARARAALVALTFATAALAFALRDGLGVRVAQAQAPAAPVSAADPLTPLGPAPLLELELPAEDVEALQRELARRTGSGDAAEHERVRAVGTAAAQGERVEVRVELLDEWSERLEGSRWPLRVDVRGDDYVFGIERFSLRAPAINGYQAEILMAEHLRREGVLAPRVFFVRVALNGQSLGVMKLQEQLGKEMIEAQERRDGAVLRFEDGAKSESNAPGLSRLPDEFLARALAFEPDAGKSAREREAHRALASGLLDGFLAGSLAAREAFDVDLTARFLAVCELWRAVDALRWPNVRFYLNPITMRLEPIANALSPPALFLEQGLVAATEAWPRALLHDDELRAAYEAHLQRLASEVRSGELAAWLRAEEGPLVRALRGERPEHAPLELAPIESRALALAGAKIEAPTGGAEPQVAAAAVGRHPVRSPVPTATREEALAAHPFLAWNEVDAMFVAPTGTHDVNGDLVLPAGAGLRAGPGVRLRFEKGALLLVRGPLELRGTAEAPVELEGRARSGGGSTSWQGIVALESSRPHALEHVVVRNTSGVERGSWVLTGGFSIHAAPVHFSHVRLIGTTAEDALNLIRSRFVLEQLEVIDTRSDALDCDFASGSIVGGRFAGIGGDAIDVSGADLNVSGTAIANVRDKAISVGERSRLVARDLTIDSVGTAVASKDGSVALVESSSLSRVTHVALMAYTKKAEYGGAQLEARELALDRVGRMAVAQLGSRVVIDGDVQASEDVDIEQLYRRGYMKK